MRKERGSITIITLTTILFMIAFLVSTFTIIANRRQAQAEIKKETQGIYEGDLDNTEQIYGDYFAKAEEDIPISTADQLFKVATNGGIVLGNRVYKCSPDANYILKNDIEFKVSDYKTKYPNLFNATTGRWINIEKQVENGTFTGTFTYNGHKITEIDTSNNTIIHEGAQYKFAYTGNAQTFTIPMNGVYRIEAWGAQGNNVSSKRSEGGLGAYTKGDIQLTKGENLYIYVGEHRTDRSASFNCGSTGGSGNDGTNGGGINGYGGGGASDIRTVLGGSWDNFDSLKSRIMVAAGGGGRK